MDPSLLPQAMDKIERQTRSLGRSPIPGEGKTLNSKPKAIYLSNWFGLVWFYDISTIVGNLMSNPVFTYILNV